ncbi:hypothetical protein FKM82_005592 [Ascaphus truei]
MMSLNIMSLLYSMYLYFNHFSTMFLENGKLHQLSIPVAMTTTGMCTSGTWLGSLPAGGERWRRLCVCRWSSGVAQSCCLMGSRDTT